MEKMARTDDVLQADSIGAVEAAAQSFGSMSPIMALCLVTPIIAAGAGLATPAAIMIAGIASLLCGRTIARFASRWSSAGSLLTYASVSLGPSWGLYSGIIYTMAMSLLTVGGIAFLAHITEVFFQFHAAFSGLVLACITSLVIGVISYQGVQISTRIQLLVTAVSAFFVLLLGVVIIVQRSTAGEGSHDIKTPRAHGTAFPGILARLWESMLPSTAPSFSGFCKATLSALLIFAGYESAAAFGEETKDASRTVPKAIVFTVIICGLFYWWASATLALGYNSGKEWASDSSTLVTLGTRFVGHWGGTLLFVLVLFDGWAGSLACVNLVSRLCYALSRQGFLPKIIGNVGSYKTPYVAIAMITCGTVVICIGTVSMGGKLETIFSFAVDAGGVLVQTSYFLVMIGGCVEFRSLEAALAATVPLGAVLGSLMGATLSLGYKFALVFLVFLGLLVACCAWCFPDRIARAVEDMHGNTGVSSTPSNEDSNKVETEPLLKA
jgi:amino acid transporter